MSKTKCTIKKIVKPILQKDLKLNKQLIKPKTKTAIVLGLNSVIEIEML